MAELEVALGATTSTTTVAVGWRRRTRWAMSAHDDVAAAEPTGNASTATNAQQASTTAITPRRVTPARYRVPVGRLALLPP